MTPAPDRPLRGVMVLLGTADVGSRVVVRHRLPDGRATDVLGDLARLDADGLAVRRPDGTVVEVAASDVVAARPVPPAPQRPSPDRPVHWERGPRGAERPPTSSS